MQLRNAVDRLVDKRPRSVRLFVSPLPDCSILQTEGSAEVDDAGSALEEACRDAYRGLVGRANNTKSGVFTSSSSTNLRPVP
jgi:hypothetical protein